jgi:2-polyprenyl-6-methoxyphenol hydroxylase-like FAD-dependent oxidoreductase
VQPKTVATYEARELVAERFQQGRVFLVGDAARTQPPTGGLGGASGIAEAYNLTWKLAAVMRREAGEALLATYDAERRPQADYTAEQARPTWIGGIQQVPVTPPGPACLSPLRDQHACHPSGTSMPGNQLL